MKIDDLLKNRAIILLLLTLFIISFIIFGTIFYPEVFYDQWIWKYYWGPIVADAQGGTAVYNGVKAYEGYTIISELTYGLLLIISIYLLYKLLKKLKIAIDWNFALALMPYIVFGPITRVLEDSGLFKPPVVYWFISPLIYLQIAIYALFFLLLGYYLEKRYNSKLSVNKVLFVGGLFLLIPSLYYVSRWILGFQWSKSTGVHFDVFLIVVFIVSIFTFLVYLIPNFLKNKKDFLVYKNPLNLFMLSGHLIDGVTSYISIKDPFSMGLFYTEKHPASNLLLEIWGPLFPIVKFLLIIIVIYVFDILLKDELKDHLNLINLLKIGIIILGFSPGFRDLLRVTMGV